MALLSDPFRGLQEALTAQSKDKADTHVTVCFDSDESIRIKPSKRMTASA